MMQRLLVTLLFCVAAVHGADEAEDSKFSTNSYKPHEVIYRDVAIIGGGSAGSYSAVRLVDHNLSVAVIEPKAQLGGHAETYVDPSGVTVDIGVVIFEPFQLTTDYFARFDVPLVNVSSSSSGPSQFINFETGEVADWEPPSQQEVGLGFAAYGEQLSKHPDIVSGYDLNYPVDEDLLLPFREFVDKYQIDGAVRSIFKFAQGYSPLLDLPAIYVLKQFGQGLLQAVTTNTFKLLTTKNQNTHELYQRVTEFLGDQVLLNTSVVSMSREKFSQPRILVDGPEGRKLIIARKVLITAPLTKVYDTRDTFDLNKEECGLFQQFFGNGYYTGIIKNTGLSPNFTADGADPDQPYGIPTLPGLYQITSITDLPGLFHVYYGIPQPKPGEDVQRDIEAAVGRIQKAQGLPPSTPEWVIFSDHTPYNTMVKPDAIRDGFYKRLLGLQGERDSFYTGATWETQDSGLIWNYTEEHVLPQLLRSLEMRSAFVSSGDFPSNQKAITEL